MALNIYKTSELLDAYSKEGTFTDPISPYPDEKYNGVDGQTKDFKLYLKNDGVSLVTDIEVTPVDNDAPTYEFTWISLATTLVGLESAYPGWQISLSDLAAGASQSFWMRIIVPAGISNQTKQDLALRVTGIE